jgi:hypothetical protein
MAGPFPFLPLRLFLAVHPPKETTMDHDVDAHDIHRLIIEHVRSPSLRHIRDKDAILA